MIEVSIWWGNGDGNAISRYLIDIPTDGCSPVDFFTAKPTVTAIRRALSEFETSQPHCRISQVDIRETPDKVLQP